MTYYSQTFVSPANGAQLLSVLFATWLPANGWTLVDTVTSGTIVSKVYQSPGSSNSFGTDFYIANTYGSTTAGSLSWSMSQQYNLSTHKMIKYAPTTAPGTTPDATDFTVVDATGLSPYDSLIQWGSSYISNSGTTFFYASVNVDRINSGGTNNTATTMGLFDSFLATDPFPIGMLQITGTSVSSFATGVSTNEPTQIAIDAKNWTLCLAYYQPAYGATSQMADIYNGGKYLAQRTYFGCGRGFGSVFTGQPIGYRGLPKDFLIVGGSGGSVGDTMVLTIGATNYTYTWLSFGTFAGSAYYMIWLLQT